MFFSFSLYIYVLQSLINADGYSLLVAHLLYLFLAANFFVREEVVAVNKEFTSSVVKHD